MKNPFLLIAVLCLISYNAGAQKIRSIKDTNIRVYMIGVNPAFHIPGADMAKRFGINAAIGANFYYKSRTNWLFGAEYKFIFGDYVKEDPLKNIAAENGNLINITGEYQVMKTLERGHLPLFYAGKVFPIFGPNANSGFVAKFGAGVLSHRIRYYWVGDGPPQLEGEYIKGYDRLTAGLALAQSVGYLHLGNKNRINFFIGLEFIEGFTRNQRSFNFDTRQKDDKMRLDLLSGLKVHWYFPIYKKPADGTFYY